VPLTADMPRKLHRYAGETPRVGCQGEGGAEALVAVFVEEDREQVRSMRSCKVPVGRVRLRTSRKRRSMALATGMMLLTARARR
jgi:hypothetical protein